MIRGINTLDDVDLANHSVILRVDFNVPLQNGKVMDDTRINVVISTIKEVLGKAHNLLIISHIGIKSKDKLQDYSLRLVKPCLEDKLGAELMFIDNLEDAHYMMSQLERGQIALLENLRFYPGEQGNDIDFARKISQLGSFYVNDAFSCFHRQHASITHLAKILPSCLGRSTEKEITFLSKLDKSAKEFTAVVGGAKVSSKIKFLKEIACQARHLLIGGAMANTFLYSLGYNIGSSLYEKDMIDEVSEIILLSKEHSCNIHLPVDCITTNKLEPNSDWKVTYLTNLNSIDIDNRLIVDIGPETLKIFASILQETNILVWNGPLGAFEVEPFDQATKVLSNHIQDKKIFAIAGGGDTYYALNKLNLIDNFTHVSIAGGAFLNWIIDKNMPGILALKNNITQNNTPYSTIIK